MQHPIKSLFKLIEIFASTTRKQQPLQLPQDHCEQEYVHDFYCEHTIKIIYKQKAFVFN